MSAALTRANKREHGTNELTQPAKTGAGKQDARQVIEGATVSDRASISGHGMTLLMHAACDGLAGTVQGLLDRGAEVNAQRSDGLNALALAAFFGHSQVVWLLLEHGADLDATGRAGTLPEMWADARGFLGVGDILREARPKQTEPTDLCTAVIDEPARFRPVENETPQQTNFPDSGVERSSSEDATEPEMMLVGPAPAEECTVGTSLTGDMPNDKPEQTLEQSVFTQPVREVGPNVIDEIMDSEITLVRATPAEECTEEKGEVTEDLPNHNPEHAQEPVLAQPVRVLKTLPDIQDPPPLLVPEFRPGSAFVARVTSSRKNLVALGLAVWLISGGIAYFLIPKILESWEGMRTEAATKTTTLPAEPGNPGAESGTRVSGAVETTSPAKSESISATPSHETKDPAAVTPSDTFANREGVESTSQVRSDEVSEKSAAGVALAGGYERRAHPGSSTSAGNTVAPPFVNEGSSAATSISRAGASASKKRSASRAARLKPQTLAEEQLTPAPLSVEMSRSSSAPSAPAKSANEVSGSQPPPSSIISGKPKAKVIQWP